VTTFGCHLSRKGIRVQLDTEAGSVHGYLQHPLGVGLERVQDQLVHVRGRADELDVLGYRNGSHEVQIRS
jgi:hypothetical protein